MADVNVAAVHHHLHRVGPPALVAVRDVLDAVADALGRDRRRIVLGERPRGKR
jgi:hypothetical protein